MGLLRGLESFLFHMSCEFIIFRPHILYGKENYSLARGVFFSDAFCQLNENLFMSQICVMPDPFLDFEALYLRAYWLEPCIFFENMYGTIDRVPNLRRPKKFRQEVISKIK